MNCVICGQFYGVERIKALVKNNQIKQHNRNRSDIGPNINNKLSFQTGFNKSHNAEMENVPTGGAFVTRIYNINFIFFLKNIRIEDVLEFFKKSFHGNHTKYQERSNSHINFQNKQSFFKKI